jgi:hypothetical protein
MSKDKKGKRKKYQPYNLYIPEILDIDSLLANCPPQFKRRPTRYGNYRDAIIYILHLINSIPYYQKDFDFEENNGFTPIHKETLRNRVHEYRAYIDYLKEHLVIEEGTNYIVGIRSMGLRFCPNFITKVKSIKINSSTLIKSIVTSSHNRDIEVEKKLYFFKSWFNPNLTIDLPGALEFLEEDKAVARLKAIRKRALKNYPAEKLQILPSIEQIVTLGYISKFIVVDRINSADFRGYPKIDNNTGRLHSPLTQLKKGLRRYLRYAEKKLCNIDIVNSQPLLALIVLDIEIFTRMNIEKLIAQYNPYYVPREKYNSFTQSYETLPAEYYTMLVKMIKSNSFKEDVIKFKEAVISGQFYEIFGNILLDKNLIPESILSIDDETEREKEIRNFAKTATFRAFFEKIQATRWCSYVKAFRACFPNVFAIFQQVKKGKGSHNTLACIFQRFESWLILHNVCIDINNNHPHIPIFTIHDSITTTIDYSNIVKGIFKGHLKEILGIEPQLAEEEW